MNQKNQLAISAVIFVQILFGLNFVASKYILGVFDPVVWAHIRFFVSFLLLGIFALFHFDKHPKITWNFILPMIPLSLLSFHIGQTFFLKGLQLTSTSNASIIATTIPIFTLIIVILLKKEKLTILKAFGFILAVIGVLILRKIENFKLLDDQLIGDIYILLASLCYAIFIATGKKFMEKYNNLWVTVWLLGISSITMIPFTINDWANISIDGDIYKIILSAAYCIIGATILTYFLNNWALSKLKSTIVAFAIYLQPIVATFIAYMFLNEQITLRAGIAIILILLGQLFSILKKA